jgi:hypothetical protein
MDWIPLCNFTHFQCYFGSCMDYLCYCEEVLKSERTGYMFQQLTIKGKFVLIEHNFS